MQESFLSVDMNSRLEQDLGNLVCALKANNLDLAAKLLRNLVEDFQIYVLPPIKLKKLLACFRRILEVASSLSSAQVLALCSQSWDSWKRLIARQEKSIEVMSHFLRTILNLSHRLLTLNDATAAKQLIESSLKLITVKNQNLLYEQHRKCYLLLSVCFANLPEPEIKKAGYCLAVAEKLSLDRGETELVTCVRIWDMLIAQIIYAYMLEGIHIENGVCHTTNEWFDHHVEWLLVEQNWESLHSLLSTIAWIGDIFYQDKQYTKAQQCYQILRLIRNGGTPCLKRLEAEGELRTATAFFPISEKIYAQVIEKRALAEKGEFSVDIAIPAISHPFPWFRDKRHLVQLRELASTVSNVFLKEGSGASAYQAAWAEYKTAREALIAKMFHQILVTLGYPACHYLFILLGSSGRGEACPYSDIECALAITPHPKDPNMTRSLGGERNKAYFRLLFNLMDLAVTSFGEPPHNDLSEQLLPQGFRFDEGGNAPVSEKGTDLLRLLQPVYEGDKRPTLFHAFSCQNKKLTSRKEFIASLEGNILGDSISAFVLLDSHILIDSTRRTSIATKRERRKEKISDEKEVIAGGELSEAAPILQTNSYFVHLQQILNTSYADPPILLREALAIKLLKIISVENAVLLDEQAEQCDLKKQLLIFPTYLLKGLAVYYDIPLHITESRQRAEWLAGKGYLCSQLAYALIAYIDYVKGLRLMAHLHYQDENETLYFNTSHADNPFIATPNQRHVLLQLSNTLIKPLIGAVKAFISAAESYTVQPHQSPLTNLNNTEFAEMSIIIRWAMMTPFQQLMSSGAEKLTEFRAKSLVHAYSECFDQIQWPKLNRQEQYHLLGMMKGQGFTRINLAGCEVVTESDIKQLLQTSPKLIYLNISYCPNLGKEIMNLLSVYASSLMELYCEGHQLLEQVIISKSFKKLETLSLQNCPNLRQVDTKRAQTLKFIYIAGSPQVQLKEAKKYALLFSKRADTKQALGQHIEAIQDYNEAIRLNPQEPAYFISRSKSKEALGQTYEAKLDYKKAGYLPIDYFSRPVEDDRELFEKLHHTVEYGVELYRKGIEEYRRRKDMDSVTAEQKAEMIKIFIIAYSGPAGPAGSSSCVLRATENRFQETSSCSVGLNLHFFGIEVAGLRYNIQIHDMTGQASFWDLARTHMRQSDVIIVVCDVSQAWLNFYNTLFSKIDQYAPEGIKLLVGNKIDLVDKRKISYEQGVALKDELSAIAYLECSAKTGEGIDELFYIATFLAINRKRYLEEKEQAAIQKPDVRRSLLQTLFSREATSLDLASSRTPLRQSIKPTDNVGHNHGFFASRREQASSSQSSDIHLGEPGSHYSS